MDAEMKKGLRIKIGGQRQLKEISKMKAVVSPAQAWFCTVVSAFGIVILSVIAGLFYTSHETMMGSITSPSDGKGVAKTILGAIVLYIAFLAFCGCQICVINRQSKIQL